MSTDPEQALQALRTCLQQVDKAEQSTSSALRSAANNVTTSIGEAIDQKVAARCSATIEVATNTALTTMTQCWNEVRAAIEREMRRIRLQEESSPSDQAAPSDGANP